MGGGGPAGKGSAGWACGFLCVSESVCVFESVCLCLCSGTTPAEEPGCFPGWRVPCFPISSPPLCSLPGATPMGSSPVLGLEALGIKMGQTLRTLG